MIKVQKAPLSFVYNKPGTNHYLVCYAIEDDRGISKSISVYQKQPQE